MSLGRINVATYGTCWLCLVVTIAGLSGCRVVGRRVLEASDAVATRAHAACDMSDIRHDTRDELAEEREKARRIAAEREVQQARMEAERLRLEMQLCRANQEREQERLRSNIRENVESKVSFNVRQGLEVGELEVDQTKLKELLKQREEQPFTDTPNQPFKQPCSCCDKTCGCTPTSVRRHCLHCRHKKCEAEKDCGGPEALREIAQQPFRQPLRPTEIPLMLPVRLTFGMQNPRVEETKITSEPFTDTNPPKRCTEACAQVDKNQGMGEAGAAPPVPLVEINGGVAAEVPQASKPIRDLFPPPMLEAEAPLPNVDR